MVRHRQVMARAHPVGDPTRSRVGANAWARGPSHDPDAPSSQQKPRPFKVPWRPASVDQEKRPRAIARSLGGAVLGWGAFGGHRTLNKVVPRMFLGSAEICWASGQAREGPDPEERWGRGPTPKPACQPDKPTRMLICAATAPADLIGIKVATLLVKAPARPVRKGWGPAANPRDHHPSHNSRRRTFPIS